MTEHQILFTIMLILAVEFCVINHDLGKICNLLEQILDKTKYNQSVIDSNQSVLNLLLTENINAKEKK